MAKAAKTQVSARRPWYRPSLTTQILIGLVLGGLIGYLGRRWGYNWGNNVYFLRDIFLNLIKSIIAPLIFSTLVVGIAGDRKSTRLNSSHVSISYAVFCLK